MGMKGFLKCYLSPASLYIAPGCLPSAGILANTAAVSGMSGTSGWKLVRAASSSSGA